MWSAGSASCPASPRSGRRRSPPSWTGFASAVKSGSTEVLRRRVARAPMTGDCTPLEISVVPPKNTLLLEIRIEPFSISFFKVL